MPSFIASQLSDGSLAKSNLVYFNPKDANELESAPGKTTTEKKNYVQIENFIFSFAFV